MPGSHTGHDRQMRHRGTCGALLVRMNNDIDNCSIIWSSQSCIILSSDYMPTIDQLPLIELWNAAERTRIYQLRWQFLVQETQRLFARHLLTGSGTKTDLLHSTRCHVARCSDGCQNYGEIRLCMLSPVFVFLELHPRRRSTRGLTGFLHHHQPRQRWHRDGMESEKYVEKQ